jgi:hypothetical protein
MARVLPLGGWKNFAEMEEYLSLDELYMIIEELNETESRDKEFQAALAGVDLGSSEKSKSVDYEAVADGIIGYTLEE